MFVNCILLIGLKVKWLYLFCYLQHEAEYRLFMEAVKGNPGEKRLASQFMTRFFKHFPGLARETINALFDLCEDADVMVSSHVTVSFIYKINLAWLKTWQ